MTMTKRKYLWGLLIILMISSISIFPITLLAQSNETIKGRWSVQKARQWYKKQPWLVGSNYIPRTAINPIAMWQEATFDPKTINQELQWAQNIGFNTVRVFLHYLVWVRSPKALKQRINKFLQITSKHHIKVMFVLWDDVWGKDPDLGPQPKPVPGIHNSGWVQNPGLEQRTDKALYPVFEAYVKDLLRTYGHDQRVLMWDLYNEPGNGKNPPSSSLPLLRNTVKWAREVNPLQPLTIGIWNNSKDSEKLYQFSLANSDIITFHNYNPLPNVKQEVQRLKKYGRPLLCSEYMARPRGSTFQTILPYYKKEDVGAINWGFVNGKTQTIYPWNYPKGSSKAYYNKWKGDVRSVYPWQSHLTAPQPKVWFHDIFHKNGQPYDSTETNLIKKLTSSNKLFFPDLFSCQKEKEKMMKQDKTRVGFNLKKTAFQKVINGKKTNLYFLKNHNHVQVAITNYGARIVGILTPDRNWHFADIVLGHDSLGGYLSGTNNYFGAIIGRYANRIAKGTFKLDGKTYHIPINDPPNSLHGGTKGFDSRIWDVRQLNDQNLLLTYDSKNGEEGYPGNLKIQVLYSLMANNSLRIEYIATTNKETVVNFTNHSYFNLNGAGNGKIYNQVLLINANNYTPIDSTEIPTGQIVSVKGTPFDFTQPTPIGKRINENNQQLKYANGYDDNWVLNKPKPGSLTLAARVYDPGNGREIEVYTTQPGLQFYSGNFLNGKTIGKGRKPYKYRTAFTLETQHFPDSPNHPNFPSTVLKPGQIFHSITIFHFTTMKQ